MLPFYLRFHTNGTAGVDVFSHNVNHVPGSLRQCFGYCSLQPSLVGVVLAHISKREARAEIVVPNTRASWFPTIEEAGVRSVEVVSKGKAVSSLEFATNAKQSRTRSTEKACER